jgi:hypothetical protein
MPLLREWQIQDSWAVLLGEGWAMTQCPAAVHHTIVVTDIENFSDPARTNLDQLAARHALYKIIKQAFNRSGVDWNVCTTEDRGDGVFILIPLFKESHATFPGAAEHYCF